MTTAIDTIVRSRNNRALLTSKRERIARIRELYIESFHNYRGELHDREIPPETLARIKEEIRDILIRERHREIVRTLWIFAGVLCIVALLLAGMQLALG